MVWTKNIYIHDMHFIYTTTFNGRMNITHFYTHREGDGHIYNLWFYRIQMDTDKIFGLFYQKNQIYSMIDGE